MIYIPFQHSLGFQHRGVEKMLAGGPHLRDAALMECVAGDTSVGHCTAYSVVLERLAGVSVPLRAQLLRRMGLEFERLAKAALPTGRIIPALRSGPRAEPDRARCRLPCPPRA